jgi:hypothetical protein
MTDRSNDYNSNIENVIFLGAGASKADGAPLQNELFRDYFKLSSENRNSNSKESHERLKNFFNIFFGINSNELEHTSFPTFEEALGVLEIALNRGESFKGYDLSADHPDIQRIRQDLIFLMAITIKEKLNIGLSHHRNLVERLAGEGTLSKTAFISLNYDILIDNALTNCYPSYDLDYGIEFANFENNQECPRSDNSWKRPRPRKSIFLYKLHGSLNWLYCPTCIALTLTPKEKSVPGLVFKSEKCKKCGSEMIPIIIPPTFFKVMSNFYLQQIWYKSEIALRQAKNIIFCGYSFSDADIHVKYLLKRAEINNGHTPEIYIINSPSVSIPKLIPYFSEKSVISGSIQNSSFMNIFRNRSTSTKTGDEEKAEKEKEAEKKRYERFFNVKEKVHYMDQSFQDFCNQGIDPNKEI